VYPGADGKWLADWPEHEGYDLGPSSMAWLTWHLGFWWSMVLDHSAGKGTLSREEVFWPGSADGVRTWISGFRAQWQALLAGLTDQDLQSAQRTQWPFQDRPFGDVLAWANVELTKSAAEIGYARFLYARRGR
ncbi:MAG: DinB family protein, partial [Polaromonas sp.]|nr:DinB family protein [Polaromonas sp.]